MTYSFAAIGFLPSGSDKQTCVKIGKREREQEEKQYTKQYTKHRIYK
jgi:hypothetical protein